MTGRPGVLAAVLNVTFGLGLGDAAEARAWLRDGGWSQLDSWIATRPNEPDTTTKTPPPPMAGQHQRRPPA